MKESNQKERCGSEVEHVHCMQKVSDSILGLSKKGFGKNLACDPAEPLPASVGKTQLDGQEVSLAMRQLPMFALTIVS